MLVDTHNHLYFDKFDADRDAVLARMADAGVVGAVVIGIDPESIGKAQAVARAHPQLRYAAGLHPTSEFSDAGLSPVGEGLAPSRSDAADIAELSPNANPDSQRLSGGRAQGPPLRFDAHAYLAPWLDSDLPPIAIGECGIDLHWDVNSLEAQRAVFAAQLELARGRELPVVIHTRDADSETLAVLEESAGPRGVLHCFNGSGALLAFARSRPQWYVSFAGNLTFPKAAELRAAALSVPLDRLLVETDAPFLAPQAVRGQRCEPAHVVHTARALAELRGLSESALHEQLMDNSRRCFGVEWK